MTDEMRGIVAAAFREAFEETEIPVHKFSWFSSEELQGHEQADDGCWND